MRSFHGTSFVTGVITLAPLTGCSGGNIPDPPQILTAVEEH